MVGKNVANYKTFGDSQFSNITIQSNGGGLSIFGTDSTIPIFSFNPITRQVILDSDVNITGSTTTSTINVSEFDGGLFGVAATNIADAIDLGISGKYINGIEQYTGIARIAGDVLKRWTFFDFIETQPVSTINGGIGPNEMQLAPVRLSKIYVNDGSAELPSIVFDGNVTKNTGFYRIATDNIGISTGGVNRIDISNSKIDFVTGYTVNIGTSGATSPLNVFGAISSSGQITNTVTTGTAPFVVASTTNVENLNASSLNGSTFPSPGPIGDTSPSEGFFTDLYANRLLEVTSPETTIDPTIASFMAPSLSDFVSMYINIGVNTDDILNYGRIRFSYAGDSSTLNAITFGLPNNNGLTVAGDGSWYLSGSGINSIGYINCSVDIANNLTVGGNLNATSLSASQAVFTDAAKNLISVSNTGTGNNVLATSPTLITPNIGAALGSSLGLAGKISTYGNFTYGTGNPFNIDVLDNLNTLRVSRATAKKCVSTWNNYTTVNIQIRSICWSADLSLFVAVSGVSNNVLTSSDGITWVSNIVAQANGYRSVCWSSELSLFAAVSEDGANRVMTSTNGTTWVYRNVTNGSLYSICWSLELSLFVAVGTNVIIRSSDGINWSSIIQTGDFQSICWSGRLGIFVAVGFSGDIIITSVDGITWVVRTSASIKPIFSVCWSPELGIFVAISVGADTNVLTSVDGVNWILRTAPINTTFPSVIWSPYLSIFVAVGSGSNSMYSSDGINWIDISSSIPNGTYTTICWSPELNIFVGGHRDSATNIITSNPPALNTGNLTVRGLIKSPNITKPNIIPLDISDGTVYTNTADVNLSQSNGDIYWGGSTNNFIGSGFEWGPIVDVFNPTQYLGINNISGGALQIKFRIFGTAFNFDNNQITLTIFAADSLGSSVGNIYSITLEGDPLVETTPINFDSGIINVTIPAGGSIRASDNEPSDNAFVLLASTFTIEPLEYIGLNCTDSTSLVTNHLLGNNTSNAKNYTKINTNYVGNISDLNSFKISQHLASFEMFSGGGWNILADSISTTCNTQGDIIHSGDLTISNDLNVRNGIQLTNSINDISAITRINSSGNMVNSLTAGNPTLTSIKVMNKRIRTSYANANNCVRTWYSRTSAADNNWLSVCWSAKLSIFVAVGAPGTLNNIMTSPNGIIWTGRTAADSLNNLTSVCWSAELSIFVAIGISVTLNNVMTSPDGITWTIQTSASNNVWINICWSSELSIFVAVSSSGSNDRVMTSSNGTSWASQTTPNNNNWNAVCWSAELSIFVAVANSGTGNRVMTSPDGITWTSRISAADNVWASVCWSAELYIFVAVAISGTGNRVMTSSDGITWTTRTSAADNFWYSVCWSAELSIFVAVADGGTGNRVMTSPDGINWTIRASAADNTWRSVCWSPELSIFVAVAESGTENRVMTSNIGLPASKSALLVNPVYMSVNNSNGALTASQVGLAGKISTYGNFTYGTGNSFNIDILDNLNTNRVSRTTAKTSASVWNNYSTTVNINIRSICWSSDLSLFVAVGITGSTVLTSINGINWVVNVVAQNNQYTSVCWSSELSLFVAVSSSGTNRVMTSSNGTTWVYRNVTTPILLDVCWSPGLSLFVAVGTNVIIQSSDGITWLSVTPTGGWDGVCWSGRLGIFVAVGGGGVIATSVDGITWISRISPTVVNLLNVCWSPQLGLFVAVGQASSAGSTQGAVTSADGISWTVRTTTVKNWESVCWSPYLSIFVAVGTNGGSSMYSSDGINWIDNSVSLPLGNYRAICWSPELNIFVGGHSSSDVNIITSNPPALNTGDLTVANRIQLANSTNDISAITRINSSGNMVNSLTAGNPTLTSIKVMNKRIRTSYANANNCVRTWYTRTSASDTNWNSVCWSAELSIFVAVASSGTGNRVMTSPDGITWTSRTSAADNSWVSVCWSAELSIFVAVSNSGTGNRVMTSVNGTSWIIRTSAADNNWNSVCWSAELSIFVAVANNGTGNRVMTSPNGITWTIRTSAADNVWINVCWSAELSIFVAVAGSGTGNRVMTSPDGITWTIRTSAADNTWRSVCWSPELYIFVAVSETGTGNRVMTSPDGITWTSRTSVADNSWYSVCWSAELSIFVAVAETGTGNRVMTSPDGINWTIRTSAADNTWRSVCWSPELSIFVTISSSGIGNRVMASDIGLPASKSALLVNPVYMSVNNSNGALTISNDLTANQKMQSGTGGGGVSSGTITFPVTFSSIPNVVATIRNTNVNNVYLVEITTVSTSSFGFIKRFQSTAGGAWSNATETFSWIAMR